MKVLVTGARGQLGRDVVDALLARGMRVVACDIATEWKDAPCAYVPLDITDGGRVMRVLKEIRPDAVIHCAAYTAVDAAQEDEERCRRVNAQGTEHVARAAVAVSAKMMYISTDYVFGGQGETPWQEEGEAFAPRSVYGKTKLEGEWAVRRLCGRHFIVRVSWVFGKNGGNFVRTMLRLGRERGALRVVCDQIGTPTYSVDLARLLADMIATEKYGVYHATNEGGYLSWHAFACEIFRRSGMDVRVEPVTTAEYGASKAERPLNSRLCKEKLKRNGFEPLPHWRDALDRFLAALKEE